MTSHNRRHGQNGHKVRDGPIPGHQAARGCGENDHRDDAYKGKTHAVLELLGNFRYLDEEVGVFHFLGSGTPGHVITEHVREKGRGNVQGEAAEENAEHEGPFEVEQH